MKTETQIARENIEALKTVQVMEIKVRRRFVGEQHKQSCQRFLKFLEQPHINGVDIKKKELDLEQAIKIYDENGI